MRLFRRAWFGATAATTLIGVAFAFAANNGNPSTDHLGVLNPLAWWTVQSNLLVGITSLLFALNVTPQSVLLRATYLTGLTALALTFLTTHTILREPPSAWNVLPLWIHLRLCHDVAPALAIGGWFTFGPRGMFSWLLIPPAVVYAIAYDAITLARGAIVDWYPYSFLNPRRLGYTAVSRTSVVFTLLFALIAAVLVLADRSSQRRDVAAVHQPRGV